MNLTVRWTVADVPLPNTSEFVQFRVTAGPLVSLVADLAARELVVDISALAPGDYTGGVELVNADASLVAGGAGFTFAIPPLATAPVPDSVTVELA